MQFTAIDLERELLRLTRTSRAVGLRAADVLSPGLERSGYALVVAVERLGPVHACQLADVLELDKSTVSRLLTSLAQRGLVERTSDPSDRRAQVVSLSDHGRTRLAAARDEHSADLARVLADWTPDEVGDAVRVIARLTDGLARSHTTQSHTTQSHPRPQTQEHLPA